MPSNSSANDDAPDDPFVLAAEHIKLVTGGVAVQ
jgi:hypothetical protein